MTRTALFTALSLLAVSNMASAEWYLGAEYSYGEVELNSPSLSFDTETTWLGTYQTSYDFSGDDSASGFALVGGYNFNEYFGLEATYGDMGSYDISGEFSGTETLPACCADQPASSHAVGGQYKATADISGFKAMAVSRLPLGESFYLKAAAGAFFSNVDTKESGVKNAYTAERIELGRAGDPDRVVFRAIDEVSVETKSSSSGSELTASLAAGFKVNEHFSVEASWNRYFDVMPSNFESDLDTYNIRALYHF